MSWTKAVPEGLRLERINEAMRDNPRLMGEDVVSWLERVNVAASEMRLSQCDEIEPIKPEREPGEDDDEG